MIRSALHKCLSTAAMTSVLLWGASTAQAAPVLLGSVDKLYGSQAGRVAAGNSGNGACDTLNATSITVRDTAVGCGRFNDAFDFSSFNAASIDHFTLTLGFGATNNINYVVFREDWKVRPAAGGVGSATLFDMANVSGTTTQSFTFSRSNFALFSQIVDAGSFGLWFAEEAFGANSFNLYSARLDVYGTAASQVPEPRALALIGLALGAAGLVRRRRDH